MNIHKLPFLLVMCLAMSCQKPASKPRQVWLYKIEGAEVLNGNVKVVSIGDSLSKGSCFIAHFDKEGNMRTSFERLAMVSSHKNAMDTTTISTEKTGYTFIYDNDGRISAMIGHTSSNHGTYTSKWNFDPNGYLVNCVPNINDTLFSTVKYKHDSVGNIIAYDRFFYPGKKNRHITPDVFRYKYDNEHRVIEEVLLLRVKGGMIISVKSDYKFLSFDQHNNWVKEMVHWNNYIPAERDSATWIQARKIAYY